MKADTANIRGKSVYEAPSESDGLRVLATRYWPRGISKDRVDKYVIDLAPSRTLLHQYRDGQLTWRVFRRQYLLEMGSETARAEVHGLAKIARTRPVTVMCVCRDEERCHRSLLRRLVVEHDAD